MTTDQQRMQVFKHSPQFAKMKRMRAYVGREAHVYILNDMLRCVRCGQGIISLSHNDMPYGFSLSEILSTTVAHNAQVHNLILNWEGYEHDYA